MRTIHRIGRLLSLLVCRQCGDIEGPFTLDGRCETCADGTR